ncbi:MAG: hypothetical protein IJ447_04450 [Clostridia bacterium]|nr:hypothetical protein [Clostridia bacterium]
MEENKKKKLGIEWIFAAVVPLIVVVFLVSNHYVFYSIPAIIFIFGSAVLSFFTFKAIKNTDRKKSSKIVISVLMIIVMLVWCLVGFFCIYDKIWKASGERALQLYSDVYFGELLPAASEIKDADKIEFLHYKEESIFPVESFTLMCTYKENEFDAKVNEVTARYNLSSKDVFENFDIYYIKPIEQENNNYGSVDEWGYNYGKYGSYHLLINNDEHQIAYVAYDSDERSGADNYEDFLNGDCGWKYF